MAILIVTYDLDKPGQDYGGVLETIKKYSYAKLSKSSYVIDTIETPDIIFEKLKPSLDVNDNLYVITLSNPRMGRANKETLEWMKKYLP